MFAYVLVMNITPKEIDHKGGMNVNLIKTFNGYREDNDGNWLPSFDKPVFTGEEFSVSIKGLIYGSLTYAQREARRHECAMAKDPQYDGKFLIAIPIDELLDLASKWFYGSDYQFNPLLSVPAQ